MLRVVAGEAGDVQVVEEDVVAAAVQVEAAGAGPGEDGGGVVVGAVVVRVGVVLSGDCPAPPPFVA